MRLIYLSLICLAHASDDQSLLQQGVATDSRVAHKSAALETFGKLINEIDSVATKSAANMVRTFVAESPLNASTITTLQDYFLPLFQTIKDELVAARVADDKYMKDKADAHGYCWGVSADTPHNDELANLLQLWNTHRTERTEELAAQHAEDGTLDPSSGCKPIYDWYSTFVTATSPTDRCKVATNPHPYPWEAELTVLAPHSDPEGLPPFLTNIVEHLYNVFSQAHNTVDSNEQACVDARAALTTARSDADAAQVAFTGAYCTEAGARRDHCSTREECYADRASEFNDRTAEVATRCSKRPDEFAGVVLIECFVNAIIAYDGSGAVDENDACMNAYANRGNKYTVCDGTDECLACTVPVLGAEADCTRLPAHHSNWAHGGESDPCDDAALGGLMDEGCGATWHDACWVEDWVAAPPNMAPLDSNGDYINRATFSLALTKDTWGCMEWCSQDPETFAFATFSSDTTHYCWCYTQSDFSHDMYTHASWTHPGSMSIDSWSHPEPGFQGYHLP